jgi:hypothetical protein
MSDTILIDYPGDGDWVMGRLGGAFNARTDHSICVHRDGHIRGGIVYTGYLGASIVGHSAGDESAWISRDFLWMVFDYVFNQLGCRKLVAMVPSSNTRAISVDLRLGFRLEGRLTEMLADPTDDLLILTITKAQCKWLRIVPKHYRSGEGGNNDIKWVA